MNEKENKEEKMINNIKEIIRWIGDDPEREGLKDTPQRFLSSLKEFFSGYSYDPSSLLTREFKEIDRYDDIILLQNIEIHSHCEHHIAPIIGKAHVAYLPDNKVIGISKIARLVDVYSRRLQIQERLTSQIANTIYQSLKPRGVAVIIKAQHHCMISRGVKKSDTTMQTQKMLGCFIKQEWQNKLNLVMQQNM